MKVVICAGSGEFDLSDMAKGFLKAKAPNITDINAFADSLERHDPLLVECVETLGKFASSSGGAFAIIEIPNGTDYIIQWDDSREWIAERHRTWGK